MTITLALVLAVAAAAWLLVRAQRSARNADDARARARGAAAVRAAIDTTAAGAWIETFDTGRDVALTSYDARWRRLFGNVLLDPRLGAVGDPEGGWMLDGGDDYAFTLENVPANGVEIVAHAWWNGGGAVGVQAAVQAEPPHRLYEATLWRRRLEILYFHGPEPDKFEVLAASPELDVAAGHYVLRLRVDFDSAAATLTAWLARLDDPGRAIARISASDPRLRPGGVGIGILGGGRDSWFGTLGVQPTPHPDSSPHDPVAPTP